MSTEIQETSIKTVQNTIDEILATVKDLSEEIIRKNPVPEEWSIIQIVNHINEFIPYWYGEIEQVIANPTEEWGRNHLQPARLAAVDTPDELDWSTVVADLEKQKAYIAEKLTTVTEEQLATVATSRNPNFGTKPASFILNHLIVDHVVKHLGQINRNLSKLL